MNNKDEITEAIAVIAFTLTIALIIFGAPKRYTLLPTGTAFVWLWWSMEKERIDAMIERKTGHWVKIGGYYTPGGDPTWACSECGKGIHVYGIEHGTYGADVSDGQWKACPNCGCLMGDDFAEK